MEYLVTDPMALLKAEASIEEMGQQSSLSALLLDGPPGTGKTYLAKYLAHRILGRLLQFQFYPGVGREELILDSLSNGQESRKLGVLPLAAELSHQGKLVLLLDELDKADPVMDSFLLTFLNEGQLLVPQLGRIYESNRSNLLVVFTKNNQREVTGPLLRRCRVAHMSWPTFDIEMAIIRQSHPEVSDEMGWALLEIVHDLRRHPDVKKPPSTPELVRLWGDLKRLVKSGQTPRTIGRYCRDALAPIPDDQRYIQDGPTYLGTRLMEMLGA